MRILLASPESHVWHSRDHIHMGSGYLAGSLLEVGLVERKWHEAYRRFYWRPKRLTRRLAMPDTWRHLPACLRDGHRLFVGGKAIKGASKTAA